VLRSRMWGYFACFDKLSMGELGTPPAVVAPPIFLILSLSKDAAKWSNRTVKCYTEKGLGTGSCVLRQAQDEGD
jgi:hypothetical protein